MLRIFRCSYLPVIVLFLISFKLVAQETQSSKSQFIEAESFFLFEEYKDALPIYQQIFRVEPDNYNIMYKIGICYLDDPYQKEKSIKYLKDAAQHASSSSNSASFKEKFAPLEAHFYLGKSYRVNNRLDEAIESFQRFKDLADPAIFDVDLVNEEINACQRAKIRIKKPVYFAKKNLEGGINTRFAESNPVISADGKTLVFNRALQFYTGVFITVKDNSGKWSEPVDLTPEFGLDGNSTVTGLSNHGDEIFVYRSDNFDGNIYSSKLVNDKWTKLIKLNENVNTKFWESHASPSPDGQYLYFTSNRPGGYGGLDIYKSKRGSNGEWGTAFNLGPVVNSAENEETPFISNDGFTLFFSSLGHETMGGYDIFMCSLQSDGTWSKPVNMGYPLCTTDDDLFYCPAGSNSTGYFSMFDASTTQGLSDIYATEVYNDLIPRTFNVKGKINMEGTNPSAYKNVTVKVFNPLTNQIVSQTALEEDGSFEIKANQGDYKVVVEGSGFQPSTSDLNLSVTQSNSSVDLPAIKLAAAVGVALTPVVTATIIKPQISAKKELYIIKDSLAVPIELKVPAGSDLKVEVTVGTTVIATELFKSVPEHFVYLYKPKPGENILRFTATDPSANISTTEVRVIYNPPVVAPEITAGKSETMSNVPLAGVLSILATGKLSKYLLGLDSTTFENSTQLYQYLLDNAEKEGFTKAEIDRLFSIYYSQKSLPHFDEEFRTSVGYSDTTWDPILKNSSIPLQYVSRLTESGSLSDSLAEKSLLKILAKNEGNSDKIFTELNNYSDNKEAIQKEDVKGLTSNQVYSSFGSKLGTENAKQLLYLSATTENLDFFYQNLILSSSGKLKTYLGSLNLKSNNIYTSIDLVEDLFSKTDSMGYSNEELIKALDLSKSNKSYYLNKFHEVLTEEATGTLKSQLQSIDLEKNNIHTYNDLLKYLLTQSQFKTGTKESIYGLLLSLTGIKDVNELVKRLQSYQNHSINKALADATLANFSTPLELIQYLLSSAGTYDYTESDINNLLIRMILEKGLENINTEKFKSTKHRMWKNPAFFNTIILVDIILVVLIILLILRKKKNR
jgi:hypothetical protein